MAQQMLGFGSAWASSSSEQLVGLAVCAEPQMVSGTQQLQTAGPALSAPCFINGIKISQNGDDLHTELDWILLQDPVQNIYEPAIFLQLKSRPGTQV